MNPSLSNSIRNPELLLEQSDWIRRLAVRLVGDPSRADDLTQETLLAAWKSGPAGLDGDLSATRRWLGRVLRNRVVMDFRKQARRETHERMAAQSERLPSTSELVERASMHAAVVAAVLRMAPDERDLLLKRFFEGRSIKQIAVELNLSDAACRKRLSRAVATLRNDLQSELGLDADHLGLALACLVVPKSAVGWTAGALASSKVGTWWLGWAAALVGLISGAFWLAMQPATAQLKSEPIAMHAAEPPAAHAFLAASPAPMVPNPAPVRMVANAHDVFTLDVRDAKTNAPIKGARVATARRLTGVELAARTEANLQALHVSEQAARWLELTNEELIPGDPGTLDPVPYQVLPERELGATDEKGQVGFGKRPEAPLYVTAPGYVPMLVPLEALTAKTMATLAVPMLAAQNQTVRVVSTFGEPIPGAFVRVELTGFALRSSGPRVAWDGLVWAGPTDSNGVVIVTGTPQGEPLHFTALGNFVGARLGEGVNVNRREVVTLHVHKVGGLTGVVVDSKGVPQAGMSVTAFNRAMETEQYTIGVNTDEDGRFRLENLPSGANLLRVETLLTQVVVPEWDLLDLGRLTLAQRHLVKGRLIDAATGAVMTGRRFAIYQNGERLLWEKSDEAGFIELDLPAGDYAMGLCSDDEAYGTEDLIGFAPLSIPLAKKDVSVQMNVGHVRFSLPATMAGNTQVQVRMTAPVGERSHPGLGQVTGLPSLTDSLCSFNVKAVNGIVDLPEVRAGTYGMEVQFSELGVVYLERVDVRAHEMNALGVLEPDAFNLSGTVFDQVGRPVAGAAVTIVSLGTELRWGEPVVWRRHITDAEGRYRMALVESRRWTAYATDSEGRASAVVRLVGTDHEQVDLNLTLQAPGWIEGVVTNQGAPVEGVQLTHSPLGLDTLAVPLGAPPLVSTEADGTFRMGPIFPGVLSVQVNWSQKAALVEVRSGSVAHVELFLDDEPEVQARTPFQVAMGSAPFAVIARASAFDAKGRSLRVDAPGGLQLSIDSQTTPQILILSPLMEWQIPRDVVSIGIPIVVDPATWGAGATLAIPSGVVEVPLPVGQRHAPNPHLMIERIPGCAPLNVPIRAAGVQANGVVRYYGIPDGADVRLIWRGTDGRVREKALTFRGAESMRVSLE